MLSTAFILALFAAPEAAHGLSATQYEAWLKGLMTKKKRPSLVSVHAAGGKAVFAAIAVDNADGPEWTARHGLTAAAYNARFKKLNAEGFRLDSLCVYPQPGGARLADLWVKDKGASFASRFDVTGAETAKAIEDQKKLGFRLVCCNGYLDERGATKFAWVFHKSEGAEWQAHLAASEMEFHKMMLDYRAKGYRPVFISAFHDGKGVRVNFTVEKMGGGWALEHNVTAGALTKELEAQAREKLVVAGVTGFANKAGASRYSAFWAQPGVKPPPPEKQPDLVPTGEEVPALAAFDQAMLEYMKETKTQAGTLAIVRKGKLAFSRGYGHLTRSGMKPVPPETPFRIGELTMPITAAAIHDLARQEKLKLSDSAFELLGALPGPKGPGDPRLKAVTIQHLLDHKGGFDRTARPLLDPMFQTLQVRKGLGLEDPPGPSDMIKFMARRKLDFAPGAKAVTSNFGYCVLGRVIEKATGDSYSAAIKKLLAPLEITSVAPGRSLPDDRDPGEPNYHEPTMAPNVISGAGATNLPDGGFNMEVLDSSSGLISSAPDLARFLDKFWLTGQPRTARGEPGAMSASLPGSHALAIQRADGVVIVALFNQRPEFAGRKPEVVRGRFDQVADNIKEWP
jgi:N-acyl-D-amino-acid deacylase